MKLLLSKNEDPYFASLTYRDTPLENEYSPHGLRTVPVIPEQLNPQLPNTSKLQDKEVNIRRQQKRNFDRCNQATELKPLQSGVNVWIPDRNSGGIVIEMTNPRSYVVGTPGGGESMKES